MKMGTTIIVCTMIAIGSFLGGEQLAHYQDRQLPPKTIVHDTKVIVDSKTTSKATADAYAINIFKDGTMFKTFSFSSVGTNFEVSVISNKKEIWKTNNTITNK
jgi:hypothetical protein